MAFQHTQAKGEPGGGGRGARNALLTLPKGGKKWFADLDGCVEYFPYQYEVSRVVKIRDRKQEGGHQGRGEGGNERDVI